MSDPVDRRCAALDALNELRHLTTCHCDEAWTGRGMHETHCASEYRSDVDLVAYALGFGDGS